MASVQRVHRLLHLVELLQSGRHYNSSQLADLCRVSRRTIFRDLQTLQDSGVPIRYDESKQGYTLPPTLFLPPADLTLEETISLLVLCHELGDRQKGLPFQQPAHSAATKLLSNLPRHLRDYVGEVTETMTVRTDPRNPLPQAQDHYTALVGALSKRRQIRIRYDSLFDGKEISTLLSPYRLFFHRRSWYVIGRSSLHRAVRTFNLGRIQHSEAAGSHYQIPTRFSLDRQLGNAWSLIRERGRRSHVVVRFQPLVARNVAEVQWHKTQKTVWNKDGTLDFHVSVDGLNEIMWWILGYGSQAEVLRPAALRRKIRQQVDEMKKTYAGKPAARRTTRRKRKSSARRSKKR